MKPSGETISLFHFDDAVRNDYPVAAGIDEAGRGPLAGPVVAAAVILQPGYYIDGLKDSKKVSENKRLKLFWEIAGSASGIGIGIVYEDIIDRTNILASAKLAMETAVKDLLTEPDILLIDAVTLPGLSVPQRSIIRGESSSASIAAASIIAKTVRDNMMVRYHEQFPQYNFKGHKGYSTREHMELIRRHGPCPIHRKSFKRVSEFVAP
ncbi:MAG TPA: ribonuclease HII [Nitrospirae bacterium]|nr:ribonuclease HII [Nitrospirota bacterium]